MPWKPGQTGNPEGNKKERLFFGMLNRAIKQDDGVRLRACAEKILDLAASGERWACELLRDTLDGRPAQQLVATDNEGRSLAIGIVAYAQQQLTDADLIRPDDTVQIYTSPVSTPAIAGPRSGH